MSAGVDLQAIAQRLLDAYENVTMLEPVTATCADFDSADAYEVLDHIAAFRSQEGWRLVGRKIGFTNRTIWAHYGVDRPMWAHMWSRTVVMSTENSADVSLDRFVQPRIEPEVVFKLRRPLGRIDRPSEALGAIEWVAPGFEIVHCHFPEWKFTIADATADFGVHGVLVIGTPITLDDDNAHAIASVLPTIEVALSCDGTVVDRGIGSNVLDGPLHALAHLTRVLADQPEYPPLGADEIVTTGTITDAWPIAPGEQWTADYGALGVDGLRVDFS